MPTFGQTIRGARLGFHYYAPADAMVRVEDAGASAFTVILSPPEKLPRTTDKTPYRCWWECTDDLLALIVPPLAGRKINQIQRLLVDNAGRCI